MLNRRILVRAVLTITASVLAFVIIACGLWWFVMAKIMGDLGESLGGCDPSKPYEIEDVASFSLPPSYQNLKSSCFGLQGWGAHAQFEMNPVDLDRFIASTRIETPLSAEDVPDNSYLPKNLSSYLYGRYESYEFSQYILIDTSDQTRYVVYVQVFGG